MCSCSVRRFTRRYLYRTTTMNNQCTLNFLDIKKLVGDQEMFSEFVYCSPSDAVNELSARSSNKEIDEKIDALLSSNIPKPFMSGMKAILFRPLFSPNYEFLRFMELIRQLGITPIFLEYLDDTFTSLNPIKHCLGRIRFRQQNGQNVSRIKNINIIDFDESQGKKIRDVKTIWGQSLVEFQHEILKLFVPNCHEYLFDASDWFHRMGSRAKNYYNKYISLFIKNSICFENFVLQGDESRFVAEIFLPNFIEIWKSIGLKPLFVELLPLDSQEDAFWMSYPPEINECILKKKMVK